MNASQFKSFLTVIGFKEIIIDTEDSDMILHEHQQFEYIMPRKMIFIIFDKNDNNVEVETYYNIAVAEMPNGAVTFEAVQDYSEVKDHVINVLKTRANENVP